MRKKIVVIACMLGFALALAGCSTLQGVGRDVQSGGQVLTDWAS